MRARTYYKERGMGNEKIVAREKINLWQRRQKKFESGQEKKDYLRAYRETAAVLKRRQTKSNKKSEKLLLF